MKNLLTLKDVKKRLPLSFRKLRELCELGDLRSGKVGNKWLVSEKSLDFFIDKTIAR